MSDLTAKARRAAEWLKLGGATVESFAYGGWFYNLTKQDARHLTNAEMIAFCEDRGWQDQDSKPPEFVEVKGVESATFNQEQEADGVEWKTTITDQAEMPSPVPETYGILELTVIQGPWTKGEWSWEVSEIGIVPVDSGTAPTRVGARSAAVEAARGMG